MLTKSSTSLKSSSSSGASSSTTGSSVGSLNSATSASESLVAQAKQVRDRVFSSFTATGVAEPPVVSLWFFSVIECLQLFLFSLDANLGFESTTAQASSLSSASAPLETTAMAEVAGILRSFRTWTAFPTSFKWSATLAIFFGLWATVGIAAMLSVGRGMMPSVTPRRHNLLRMVYSATPALFVVCMHACLSLLICDFGAGSKAMTFFSDRPCWSGASQIGWGALAGLVAFLFIVFSLLIAAFDVDISPASKDPRSRLDLLVEVLWFTAKLLLVLSSDLTWTVSEPQWIRETLVAVILTVAGSVIAAYTTTFLPYWSRPHNCIRAAAGGATALSGVSHLVMLLSGLNGVPAILLVIFSGIVGAALSVVAVLVRYRLIVDLSVKPGEQTTGEFELPSGSFRWPWQIELASRFAHKQWPADVEEKQRDRADLIFIASDQLFPNSDFLRICRAVSMVEYSDNDSRLTVLMKRIGNDSDSSGRGGDGLSSIAMQFLAASIDRRRRKKTLLSGSTSEEISLFIKSTKEQQDRLAILLGRFWKRIAAETDFGEVLTLLSRIERTCQRIHSTYKQMMKAFPRSTDIMRSYSEFLEHGEHDSNAAAVYLAKADEIEELEAQRKRKHFERRKENHGHHHRTSKVAPIIVVQEKEHEAEEAAIQPIELEEPAVERPGTSAQVKFSSSTDAVGFRKLTEGSTRGPESARADGTGPMTASASLLPAFAKKADNQQRYRMYRQRANETRLNSGSRLQMSLLITWLIALVCLVILFSVAVGILQKYTTEVAAITSIELSAMHVHSYPLFARIVSNAMIFNDTGTLLSAKYHFELWNSRFQSTANQLWTIFNAESYKPLYEAFFHDQFELRYFIPKSNSFWTANSTLWDFFTTLISRANMVIASDFPPDEFGVAIESNADFRFFMDNGPRDKVLGAIDHVLYEFGNRIQSTTLQIQLALGITFPFSVLLAVVTVGVLFVSTIRGIRTEYAELITLLLEIPKSFIAEGVTASQVTHFQSLSHKVDPAKLNLGVARRLTFISIALLIAIFGAVTAVFTMGLQTGSSFKSAPKVLENTGSLVWHPHRMHWLCFELLYPGPSNSWPNGESEIKAAFAETMSDFQKRLRDAKYLTGGLIDSGMSELLYSRQCQVNETRYVFPYGHNHIVSNCGPGMQPLADRFIVATTEWMALNNTERNYKSPLFRLIHSVDLGQFHDWVMEAIDGLAAAHSAKVSKAISILTAIFAVTAPLSLLALPLLLPLVNQIKAEQRRTVSLLVSIPIEAIDATPSILALLETGQRTSALERVERDLESISAKTVSILEAATDAVIVMDNSGVVEVFNAAATRMLGWKVDEAVGQLATKILPFIESPSISEFFESMAGKELENSAVHKDGSRVPIVMTMSKGESHGVASFAAFLRDLREINRMKELVAENDRLFKSMMPEAIGNKIKRKRTRGLAKAAGSLGDVSAVIASEYNEVTILFADIVGFTAFASKRRATEIVGILNELFCAWDALLDVHGVEKIKTIGDCYMCCCGAPTVSQDHAMRILDFALDMMAALARIRGAIGEPLDIRIGINSGNVVGGVIGNRRMLFDIWGSSVNLASRMESTGIAGRIQVAESTFRLLNAVAEFKPREGVQVKGEGVLTTYLFIRKKQHELAISVSAHASPRQEGGGGH